jgi:hypothetical protein
VSWLPPEVKDGMELIIASAAALSGMVLAFVTGEILAVLALQAQHDTTAARLDYEADMAVWRDNLAQSWKADRGRLIGAAPRADTRRSAAAPAQTDTRRRRPDRQDAPPSPTELKALRFLSQRSDADQLTVRQLAALAGVNRDASSKALQRWRQGVSVPVSERQNGHGEGVEDE